MAYSPFTGREYPDLEPLLWGVLGGVMHRLLTPEPEPGPPYVHTLVSPEPTGYDEDENPVYPEPGPTMTITKCPTRDSALTC